MTFSPASETSEVTSFSHTSMKRCKKISRIHRKKTSDLAQTGKWRYLTCIKTFRRRHQQMTDRLTLFYSFAQFVQYTCSLPTECWDYERPVWCVGVWSASCHTSASYSQFYISVSKRKTCFDWSRQTAWFYILLKSTVLGSWIAVFSFYYLSII